VKPKKRKQVSLACTNCRRAKTACSHKRPCDRCSSNGLQCIDVPRRRRSKSHPEAVHHHQQKQQSLMQECGGVEIGLIGGRERSNSICSQLNLFSLDSQTQLIDMSDEMTLKLIEEYQQQQPIPIDSSSSSSLWLIDQSIRSSIGEESLIGLVDEGLCDGDHQEDCLLCGCAGEIDGNGNGNEGNVKESIVDEGSVHEDPFWCDIQTHIYGSHVDSENPFFL